MHISAILLWLAICSQLSASELFKSQSAVMNIAKVNGNCWSAKLPAIMSGLTSFLKVG